MEKLRNYVNEEVVKAILKIPTSISKGPDKLVWSHSKTGLYSVKSGYFQARKGNQSRLSIPSSSYSPSKSMWSRLWTIPTPPNIRIFMWKVVQNWIACKQNLFHMKCGQNPLCSICEAEGESIERTLFRCYWTKVVGLGVEKPSGC